MKIENSNLNTVPFEQINVGDTFILDNNIFMKIVSVEDALIGHLNAVDICDGCSILCYDDTMVHPVEGSFHVEKIW